MKRFLAAVLIGATLFGCGPRGETKNLSEIFDNARARYSAALGGTADISGAVDLRLVSQRLGELADQATRGKVAGAEITGMASTLTALINHAGPTNRPGFDELVNQFRAFQVDEANSAQAAASLKLLLARTYTLLANELETTKFRL